ncbi:FAD-dependent oxidoreductase [Candidatus Albibeggiatoa sp. nov. NOAA]|uniref:FAD-dependent oxidoreductase n=1 Tax=Candidatus Albibeggiatoa sp. nov. NOAA TaxID=3162724 RepID=UPI0032F9FF87|nr:FAD-dependent oxidoreductase [Thiotrichaceae bacterium]
MKLSRRKFLTVAAAGSTLGALKLASAKELSDTLGGTQSQWQMLRAAIQGQVYLPADEGFGLKAMVNNLRYMRRLPPAIAIIDDAIKAQRAIQWCQENQIKFHIKGGGHSYAGFSAASSDEPVLILYTQDMRNRSTNLYDPDTGNMTVGAGAINYQVYQALAKYDRSITHGRCPMVGVAGFVLGGGIGFDMRRYGMASDLLVSAEIVLASGKKVKASKDHYSDLFWALRGGAGGNFGLSTAFEFKTHDVKNEQLSVFHKQYSTSNQSKMENFLAQLMIACQDMTNDLGIRISVQYIKPNKDCANENQFLLDFIGQWSGDEQSLTVFFNQFENILKPKILVEHRCEYWAANHYLEDADETYFYQERSTFIPDVPAKESIRLALEQLKKRPDVHGLCDLRFFQMGGVVNEVPKCSTAFVHRDSQWIALVGYYWEQRDDFNKPLIAEGHKWQDEFYNEILLNDFKGKGAYQNFPDVSLKNWAEAYYGDNLPRLKGVKLKYDPDCVFDYKQAIQPASII